MKFAVASKVVKLKLALDTWSNVSLLTVITKVWERKRRRQCKLVKYFRLQLPPHVVTWQPKKDQTYLYCFLYVCCAHMFVQVFAFACVWSPQEEKHICFKTHSMYGWFHTRGQVPDLCTAECKVQFILGVWTQTCHARAQFTIRAQDHLFKQTPVYSGKACMKCVRDARAQTKTWPAVVFDQPVRLNRKTRLHMVAVGASEVKNNLHSAEEDSIVQGCALHLRRDTPSCSEHKQVAQLNSSSRGLAVCKPTRCAYLPAMLDCVQHMQ